MRRRLGSGVPDKQESPAWSLSALRWGLLGVLGPSPISCGWFGPGGGGRLGLGQLIWRSDFPS